MSGGAPAKGYDILFCYSSRHRGWACDSETTSTRIRIPRLELISLFMSVMVVHVCVRVYVWDGQIEKVLSSLHLRVSEIGEDMRLHHHFSTLSVNAANIRLRRVLRASLLQYGLMIITTVVAVRMRMCDTLNIAEKRNGRSSPLSSISAVLNCQRSVSQYFMHCFDRVVVCVHRLLLLTVFEFDCSTIQCVCVYVCALKRADLCHHNFLRRRAKTI